MAMQGPITGSRGATVAGAGLELCTFEIGALLLRHLLEFEQFSQSKRIK